MVYNTQNYWGVLVFPSSGILETRNHDVSETGSVSVLRDLNELVSLPTTPEDGNIQFPKRRAFWFLEYRTMEKVLKPSNSDRNWCFSVQNSIWSHKRYTIMVFHIMYITPRTTCTRFK
jgi:hypothetical protein